MLPARPTEKEPVTRHPVVEDPRNERGRRREPERKVPECWELGHRRMGERPGSLEAAPRHRLYPQAQENQHPPDWVLSPNAAGYHWASWGGEAHSSRPPHANMGSPHGKHAHWPPGHPSSPGCRSWMATAPSRDGQTPGLPGLLTKSGCGSAGVSSYWAPTEGPGPCVAFSVAPFLTQFILPGKEQKGKALYQITQITGFWTNRDWL